MGLVFGMILGEFISQYMRKFRLIMIYSKWIQLLPFLLQRDFASPPMKDNFLFSLNLARTNDLFYPQNMTGTMLCKLWAHASEDLQIFTLRILEHYPEMAIGGNWISLLEDERLPERYLKTARLLPVLTSRSMRKAHWLPAQSPWNCISKARWRQHRRLRNLLNVKLQIFAIISYYK